MTKVKYHHIYCMHCQNNLVSLNYMWGAQHHNTNKERPTEHVKSTNPCTNPDLIESKNCPKNKKANASMNFEEAIPVKKAIAVGMKRSIFIKKLNFCFHQNTPKRWNILILAVTASKNMVIMLLIKVFVCQWYIPQ